MSDDLLRPQPEGIPQPRPSRLSEPYWQAAAEGRLVYQQCPTCGHLPRRPAAVCPSCHGREMTWAPSTGRGVLYSWTVVWRPQHPSFRVPYAPAVMAVDEGWWLMTSLVGCRPDQLAEGMPLRVEFHPCGGGLNLPYASPVAED